MVEQRIQQHFIDSADLKYRGRPDAGQKPVEPPQALLACVTGGGKVLACGPAHRPHWRNGFATLFIGRFRA